MYKGVNIAYKTDKLLNEQELKALEDIIFCIAYFFQISNIRLKEEDFPKIIINSKELPFKHIEQDPLLNVKF